MGHHVQNAYNNLASDPYLLCLKTTMWKKNFLTRMMI